jgi:hypothetical protein
MNWQKLKPASLDDILAWAESQPWCRAMADCAQDVQWHSEGDVWTHTKMVCQQLAGLSDWPTLTSDERTMLTFTALFQDAAIMGTDKRLQLPSLDEGFDRLYYVRPTGDGDFVVEEWRDEA